MGFIEYSVFTSSEHQTYQTEYFLNNVEANVNYQTFIIKKFSICLMSCIFVLSGSLSKVYKVNHFHYRPEVPRGFQEVKVTWQWPRMVVRLSASLTDLFLPQEMLLVLISIRGWVDPRPIVQSEGLYVNKKFQWHQLGSNQRPSDL